MDTLEANKKTAIAWLDQISRKDVDTTLLTTAPEWIMHGGPPNLPSGPDGVRTLFALLADVEQTWIIDDTIAEGDRVVVRATNKCQQPEFFGIPAAGLAQVFTATFIFRFDDGKIAEIWRNADDLGRLLQIGARLMPPDQAAGDSKH